MNRREALLQIGAGLAATAVGPARAAEPPARSKMGVVVYALGLQQRLAQQKNAKPNLHEPSAFLGFCRGLGADGVQVPLGVCDEDAAARLRRQAEDAAMFIEGIVAPPRDPQDVERFAAEIATAARIGAAAVRTVLFPGRRYEQFDTLGQFRAAAEQARRSVELAAPVVEKHRVRLGVENHKDQRAADLAEMLKRLDSEWVGACVDVGNNLALLEDPLTVVQTLAPWAVTVHLKDHVVAEYADGFLLADAPLGGGVLDLKAMVAALRQARPGVHFSLETITRDPLKVPCLGEKYWATFAEVGGRDLARTLRWVRTRPPRPLPQVASLPLAQQAELELANVRQSLAYAREQLGL